MSGAGRTVPSRLITLPRPPCSATNRRPDPSWALVMKTGLAKPLLNGVSVSVRAAAVVTAPSLTGAEDAAPTGVDEATGAAARADATATTRMARPKRGTSGGRAVAMEGSSLWDRGGR